MTSKYVTESRAGHVTFPRVFPIGLGYGRGGCERVIECNRSSSAHHRVCTFFPSPFNPVGKGSGHAQTTRDMVERQSPDGNKRPRGTPTW